MEKRRSLRKSTLIGLILIFVLILGACNNTGSKDAGNYEISALFTKVYTEIANDGMGSNKGDIVKKLESTGFKLEDSNSDGLLVSDKKNTQDNILMSFDSSENLLGMSYYNESKDVEVSYFKVGEDKIYSTHILGNEAEDVQSIDDQVDFLKNVVNKRKEMADKEKLDKPIQLELSIKDELKDGGLIITLETNLPNETIGMVTLENEKEEYKAQANFEVKDGIAKVGPYSFKGKPLPKGDYKVFITTPFSRMQNDVAYPKLGKDYSNYKGKEFDDRGLARIINCGFEISI